MNIALGISWGGARAQLQRAVAAAGVLALLAPLTTGAGGQPITRSAHSASNLVSVIVREIPGLSDKAEHAVKSVGGTVGRQIGIINSFTATIPANMVTQLERAPGISWVSPDRKVKLLSVNTDTYSQIKDPHSALATTVDTGARYMWWKGYTGQGVDVAVIDSGVAPVNGMTAPGKLVHGPDLSFESQSDELSHVDTYGHGTHMAGIIAGRDDEVASTTGIDLARNTSDFVGMAPDARIISLKVADADGSTDVSQMLAAIDWVVQHKNDPGMNIRVLNLSFGTDSQQDYRRDPLAYAAEVAWQNGIVVVAASGNAGGGPGSVGPGLTDPAYDPYVVAVGAADTKATWTHDDDVVADFSSGAASASTRRPDLVAPGTSIASLRVPGSHADEEYSATGGVTDRLFRGSGTSQAAAVVSGAAALLLSQRPTLTPDQVKRLLMTSADVLPGISPLSQGSGELNLFNAFSAKTPNYKQNFQKSAGDGSIEAARGSNHIYDSDGVELNGEKDIFGNELNAKSLALALKNKTAWKDGTWNGSELLGGGFVDDPLKGHSWSGHSWSGHSWSGHSWSDKDWSGHSWSGHSWSGHSWSGHSWSGHSWSDNSWSDGSWS